MKLSIAQQRALAKLTDRYHTAYELSESLPTLNALVKKGFALRNSGRGVMFCPQVAYSYKRTTETV